MKKQRIYRHGRRYLSPRVRRMRRLSALFSILLVSVGGYLLLLSLSPQYEVLGGELSINEVAGAAESNVIDTENKLIIEKLGLNLPIGTREGALSVGAWQRYAQRSNPLKGGNMILVGHRFELGWTPQQTKQRSPFYKLNTMAVGDPIEVLYEGKTYTYKVVKTYHVEEADVWVEDDSTEHKLTVYTCELGGADKGRLVVEALPI